MEFLKAILGDAYEQFATAINTYNEANKDKQVKLADLGSGEYVSAAKYKSLETELAGVKETIKTHEGTIDTLKKANKDNELLQQTIKDHETTISTLKTEYDSKVKNLVIDNAIQGKLKDAKHADLLIGKFDRSKLVVSEDGTVTGIDEQVESMKKAYADLFKPDVKGTEPNNNGNGVPKGKNPWSKATYNLTEQGRLLKEDPELAKQYMASAN